MSTWEKHTPILKVTDVVSGYGDMEILHGMSLTINAGDIAGIIGSNGAGKSTFFRTISGLLPATKGEIFFKGVNITKLPPHHIFKMGMAHVPENRALFGPLSVYENLLLGCYPDQKRLGKNGIKARVDRIFELFPRLAERRNQASGSMSGGEQQMLVIGRALMSEPTLILLDEPSSGLAPIMVEGIGKVVQELNKQGVTFILNEQGMEFAFSISTRALVFELGRVAMEGDPKVLKNDPKVKEIYFGHN